MELLLFLKLLLACFFLFFNSNFFLAILPSSAALSQLPDRWFVSPDMTKFCFGSHQLEFISVLNDVATQPYIFVCVSVVSDDDVLILVVKKGLRSKYCQNCSIC